MSRRARQGFTLIETLVVIGMVAVLIGTLLPAITSSRKSARTVRCLASLRQLSIVDQIYQGEFRGWHLPAYWGWSPSGTGWNPNTPPTIPASGPYQSWANVPLVYRTLGPGKTSGRFYRQILCPDAPLAQTDGTDKLGYGIGLSYGMNQTQLPGYAVAGGPDYFNAWRSAQVRSPSQKIQWTDAIGAVTIGGTPNPTLRYFLPTWGEVHYPPDHTSIVAYRHHRGACAAYYDGHAEWSTYTALVYDPTVARTTFNKRQWQPTTP